ncbi:MAG: hypothetical protein J6Y37_04135 [Paludibacteraceae bacterium]|nr:hypothetical protein [Paludibacteraceae bacterium]
MAIIPFFSSCSKIYNGLKNILKEVAHEMEEETKKTPFEPLEGYKIFTIERTNLKNWHDYKFPYIQMEDKEVERKVNGLLQMRNFGVVFNGPDGSCVDGIDHIVRLSYAGKPTTKFYDDSFSRNLSIKIAITHSDGIETLKYYNFNPKTGDLYHLEDFFSEENYYLFQCKLLGYELIDEDDLVDLSNFEFNQDKIEVRISLSSRFDLTKYLKINISDIEPLLNDYGRAALITGEGLEKYHTDLPPLLYEGTIGDEPVYYLREHPFRGGREQLFFKNTGKYGELDGEWFLLEYPEQSEIIIDERDKKNIRYCDSYWYDGSFWIEHIERDTAALKPGDQDYHPRYVYKDMGKDLFCYRVTEEGLEGYYQTPYPLDHYSKVTAFGLDEDEEEREEERYRYRIKKYGVKPQKYQVKLKKM